MKVKKIRQSFTDDAHQRILTLVRLRFPWLTLGLLGGILASVLVSRFEHLLTQNISLAFFVPIIVYMADAVGTQTETMYVRSLSSTPVHFLKYLFKEFVLGIILGSIFGLLVGFFAWIWIGSTVIAFTVGLAMLANVAIAPVVALIVPEILFEEHTDPALGAGPFATVIQDVISLFVYFLIAAVIIGQVF
ncbi:MAG TPA: magnesium transporter [Patescibacteria group bacterium]|nr:magnesium transporter [Patescibacteria group bacterium]